MTNQIAEAIKARFYATPGWGEVEEHHPKFKAAIDMLPDESGMLKVNVMLVEMYNDAKKDAELLFKNTPHHLEQTKEKTP